MDAMFHNEKEQTYNKTNAGPLALGGLIGVPALGLTTLAMLSSAKKGNTFKFNATTELMSRVPKLLSNLSNKGLSGITGDPWDMIAGRPGRVPVMGIAGDLAARKPYEDTKYVKDVFKQFTSLQELMKSKYVTPATSLMTNGIDYVSSMHGNLGSSPRMTTYNLLQDASNLINKKHTVIDVETSMSKGVSKLRELTLASFTPSNLLNQQTGKSLTYTEAERLMTGTRHMVVMNDILLGTMDKFRAMHHNLQTKYGVLSAENKYSILSSFAKDKSQLWDLATIAGFKQDTAGIHYSPSEALMKKGFDKGKFQSIGRVSRHKGALDQWANIYNSLVEGAETLQSIRSRVESGGVKKIAGGNKFVISQDAVSKYLADFIKDSVQNKTTRLVGQNIGFDIDTILSVANLTKAEADNARVVLSSTASDSLSIAAMMLKQGDQHIKDLKIKNSYARGLEDLMGAYSIKRGGKFHWSWADSVMTAQVYSKQLDITQSGKALTPAILDTIKPGALLLSTGKYQAKRTGNAFIDNAMDQFFHSRGNLYSVEDIHKITSGGTEAYMVKFGNLSRDIISGAQDTYRSLDKTRDTFGIFGSLAELQEAMSSAFTQIKTKGQYREAVETSTMRGRDKAFDVISHAIGVNQLSASNRRLDVIRDLVKARNVPGGIENVLLQPNMPPDSMHHYARTKSFIDVLDQFHTNVLPEYDKIINQLKGVGKTGDEIEVILASAHKELGVGMRDLFKTNMVPANQFNRQLPLHQGLIDKISDRGNQYLKAIRLSSMETATQDVNRLLGVLRAGRPEETSQTAVRELLGNSKGFKLTDQSELGKMIQHSHPNDYQSIIKDINKTHGAKFRILAKDASGAGELIADILVNTPKIAHTEVPILAAEIADKNVMTNISKKAMDLAKSYTTIHTKDDLLGILKGSKFVTSQTATPGVDPMLKEALSVSDEYLDQFATRTFNLFKDMQSNMKSKNSYSKVMMRVAHEGRGVEIGILPGGSADAQRAFMAGEMEFKGRYGENDIHRMFIPTPSEGGSQYIEDRIFENKTFIEAPPVGFEGAKGNAVNIGKRQYERYTPSDLALHSYENAMGELTASAEHIGAITGKIQNMNKMDLSSYNMEQIAQHKQKIAQLTEELQVAHDMMQTAINSRRNAVTKLLSVSGDSDWLIKVANAGSEVVTQDAAIQAGSIADMIAGNKLQFRMANDEGRPYVGFDLLEQMSGKIGELVGEGVEHVNYIKDSRKVKGEIPGVDLRKITPWGNWDPSLTPRIEQYLRQNMLNVDSLGGKYQVANFGSTEEMNKIMAAGAAKVAGTGYEQHAIPAMGARISFKDHNALAKMVSDISGETRLGLTVEESSMVVKDSLSKRAMGTKDTPKTVAKQLVDSIYRKGHFVEHGDVIGFDKANKEIRYHHPLEMTSKQMSEAFQIHGITKKPDEFRTLIKDVVQEGDHTKFILQEKVPLMAGTGLYAQGQKGTMNILEEKYFSKLNLPESVEFLLSPKEQAKESRSILGSMIESHANLATMIRRDDTVAEQVARFHGMKTSAGGWDIAGVKAQAESIHNILGVKYNQATGGAVYPVSSIKPGGTLNDIRNIISKVESHQILKYVDKTETTATGKIIQYAAQLTASNLHVSSEMFFARLTGATKNKMWEGASLSGLEGNLFDIINAPGLTETYVKNLDKTAVEIANDTKRALESIVTGKPEEGFAIHKLSDFEPMRKKPGGGYTTEGLTMMEQLDRHGGMYVELPVPGNVNVTKSRYNQLGDIGGNVSVSSVYLPKLNAYHQDEAVMDKYASLLSRMHSLTDSTSVDDWLGEYANYIREDIGGGKQSAIARALKSTHDFSAVMRVAPTATAEAATMVMHPSKIKEMLGENALEMMQHFEAKGKGMLMGLHRFPTAYTTSFGVVKLQANEFADPHRIFTDIGNWSLSKGDFDADLAIAFEMMGLSKKRIRKLNTELSSINANAPDYAAQRAAVHDKLFNEISITDQYKDMSRLYEERKALATRAAQAIHEDYYGKDAASLQTKYSASTVFDREAVGEGYVAYNEKLGQYQSSMMENRIKYARAMAERGMGTKGLAGIESNYSMAIQNMTSDVYGAIPAPEHITQAQRAYDFAGGINDSSLSTKSAQSPAKLFENIMQADKYSDVGKLKTQFMKQLESEQVGDTNMLRAFAEDIGKLRHPGGGDAAYKEGVAMIDAGFDVFAMFAKQHGEEILGEGTKYVSPAVMKGLYERQGFVRGFAGQANKHSLQFYEGLKYQGNNMTAALGNEIMNTKGSLGRQLLGEVESALIHVKSNKGLLAAAAIGATLIGTVAVGSALSGSPKLSKQSVIPPIQRPSTRDTIYGEPQPTYETTVINVKGKTKQPIEGLDRLTMMALQNSMPVRLDGSININDNRRDAGDVVNEAFARML